MKLSWRDILAAIFAMAGGLVVFAKLQSYSWAMIGSWKGALGVEAVLGLGVFATYFIDWIRNDALGSVWEMLLWIVAATVVVGGLFAKTTKAEFLWSSLFIGASWLSQLGAHTWDSSHDHTSRLAHVN